MRHCRLSYWKPRDDPSTRQFVGRRGHFLEDLEAAGIGKRFCYALKLSCIHESYSNIKRGMTRQERMDDYAGKTFGPFTDFSGKEFHNASFQGAVFEGKVTFTNTKFTGRTDFSGARLK